MTAQILDGEALSEKRFEEVANRVSALKTNGTTPKLVTILVGNDADSAAYISRKHQNCKDLGVASDDIRLAPNVTEAALLDLIAEKNRDPSVHGVLVQLPLPSGFDEGRIIEAISPQKDVDGLHPINLGRLLSGKPAVLPCTPAGIADLLISNGIETSGARIAILGRGSLVGRPLAMVLSLPGYDGVVTLLHSRTANTKEALLQADIVVSAVGQVDLVRAGMIRKGACVVGVGISYINGQMVSDIAEDVRSVAGYVTPPHGSVGALTRAHLLLNLIKITEASASRSL